MANNSTRQTGLQITGTANGMQQVNHCATSFLHNVCPRVSFLYNFVQVRVVLAIKIAKKQSTFYITQPEFPRIDAPPINKRLSKKMEQIESESDGKRAREAANHEKFSQRSLPTFFVFFSTLPAQRRSTLPARSDGFKKIQGCALVNHNVLHLFYLSASQKVVDSCSRTRELSQQQRRRQRPQSGIAV